jgi:chromosome partitioning protein
MIILVSGIKGGSGKSTICCQLAAAISQQNSVIVIDCDHQATSFDYFSYRANSYPELSPINCIQEYGKIDAVLLESAQNYDYVLCDVSGRDSSQMREALLVANVVITPFKPTSFDLSTIPLMDSIIESSKKINKHLVALAVISIAPTNTSVDIEQSKEVLVNYTNFILCKTVIYNRKCYTDIGKGIIEQTVNESSLNKGKQEIINLTNEVLSYGSK